MKINKIDMLQSAKRNINKSLYEMKLSEAKKNLEQRTYLQYFENDFLDINKKRK